MLLLRLLAAFALLAISLAAARRSGEAWSRYCGLTGDAVVAPVLWGAGLGLAFAASGLALERAVGFRLFHLAPPAQAAALPAALAYAALWWPLLEEWLCRGFLQRLCADRWGAPAGIAVQAVLFAALHAKNHLGWPHLLTAAAFGLLAGALRQRTHSLWPGVAAHLAANAAVLLWYFAGS